MSSSYEDELTWEIGDDIETLVNVFSFGWMEDGRCGYPMDNKSGIQLDPRPLSTFRHLSDTVGGQYVCKSASAGSRHSLYITLNCRKENSETKTYKKGTSYGGLKKKHVMISGLNQLGLCEEKGFDIPQELIWDDEEDPTEVIAGNGNSFIISLSGAVYSFGFGNYGVLGHDEERSCQIPRRIMSLKREKVVSLSLGSFHVLVVSEEGNIYTWGRNHKGQLGRGFISNFELTPSKIETFSTPIFKNSNKILEISCGAEYSLALIRYINKDKRKNEEENKVENRLYGWGDNSKGQLGVLEYPQKPFIPQENKALVQYEKKHKLTIGHISAGGHHVLALTFFGGQVLTWGANDYGQLGNGHQFDEVTPQQIAGIKGGVLISAGLRHSMCICEAPGSRRELIAWGYNGYGELGLGDLEMRIVPTKNTAFEKAQILNVSCGDRHTVVITSHIPLKANESHQLKPYFAILEEQPLAVKSVKIFMKSKGIDPNLIDEPDKLLPDQVGSKDEDLENKTIGKGLQYCLDTFVDETDW
eukprot:CAMPEP_0119046636 /NCGR_PEP_ID=MMETSP1177-20130426/47913_1 /TAXON_ID=2985 /ORGANISM="Ochromonas sp, Strain CCMP1899" /LENGTH=528 /DNA_ID=CAMNT_0007020065 /DNA_START=236 /DNA_END=1819 /DNA_ORIENTATION=-